MSTLVILRRLNYRHEAEVIRSVLEANDIEAVVTSDDCGSVDPALGLVRGVCVAVNADAAARAEEILDIALEPATDADALAESEPRQT